MANYSGKSPLRMECPHCGIRDEHPVTRTDPANYHWSDEAVPLFQRIAGRDISYRRRSKTCKSCSAEFNTVEMADIYLGGLIQEIDRLIEDARINSAELSSARDDVSRLESVIDTAILALAKARES